MSPTDKAKNVKKPGYRKQRSRRKSSRKTFHGNQYTQSKMNVDDSAVTDVAAAVNSDFRDADYLNSTVNIPSVNTPAVNMPTVDIPNNTGPVVDVNNTLAFDVADDSVSSSVPVNHPPSVRLSSVHVDDIESDFQVSNVDELEPTVAEKKTHDVKYYLHPKDDNNLVDNEIMDMDILSDIINLVSCPECKESGMKLTREKRYGLATKLLLFCPDCDYEKQFWTSKKADTGRSFEINARLTYSMRSVGVGLEGSKTFLSLMNLPPPVSRSAHHKLINNLHHATKTVSEEIMNDAADEVRQLSSSSDDVVETSVSCDGTWQKRGFSSLNGAVAVLSIETGKVLDVEVMSRYCNICVYNEKMKKSNPDFLEENHDCRNNHKGSAPAMERDGTVNIFARSAEKRKLLYTNFYGDGDTKSFYSVEDIYPGKKVKKFECVGHVQKRFGKRLRTLKKTVKGLGGNKRLTESMIDKLQLYYGIAIRRSCGKDVASMKTAIWGGFFHVASSATQIWHDHCESGPDSWCKYKADIANNTKTYKPGPGLPPDVIKHVKPILIDLTKDELLEKCLHGMTQNQNESFNSTIWLRAPKGTYVGLQQLEIAVFDAVSHFNVGKKAAILTYEKLGIRPGGNMISGCVQKNKTKIEDAKRHTTEAAKKGRRYRRAARANKLDKTKAKEGKLYGAGAF